MTPDTTWRFEAWTHPRLGTPTYITDVDFRRARLANRDDAVVDSWIEIPSSRHDLIDELIDIDPITMSSSKSRIIRAFRTTGDGTADPTLPDLDFVAAELTWNLGEDGALVAKISGPHIKGSLDDARALAFDYPANPSYFPDWFWDGPNKIDNGDFEQLSNEIQRLYIDGMTATDTFTITFDTQTTAPITWGTNPSTRRADTETALENLSNITDVDVLGSGTALDPFEIEFVNPGRQAVATITATPTGAGIATIEIIATGGFASLEGWTKSYNPVSGLVHGDGGYVEFRSTNPDFGETGITGDGALILVVSKQYAGAQRTVGVSPNSTIQVSIDVKVSSATESFRLVARDMAGDEESLIATSPELTFVANTPTTVKLTDVQIPNDTDRILIRFAITSQPAGNTQITIDNLVVQDGLAGTTKGGLVLALLTDLQTTHAPRTRLDWLGTSFTAAIDSSAAAWADPSFPYAVRAGMQIGTHVLAGLNSAGTQYDVRPVTLTTWALDLWEEGNRGSDLSTQIDPAFMIGAGITDGTIAKRLPSATGMIARGADGAWVEQTDADLVAAFGDIDGYLNNSDLLDTVSLTAAVSERLIREKADALSARCVTSPDGPIPYADVNLGDIVPFDLPGRVSARHNRTIRQFVISIDEDGAWVCEWIASRMWSGDSATQETLRRFLTQFEKAQLGTNRNIVTPSPATIDSPTAVTSAFPTVLIAAYNAPDRIKAVADLVCDGTNDDAQITEAFALLAGPYQGRIFLSAGNFSMRAGQLVLPANTSIIGAGKEATWIQVEFGSDGIIFDASNGNCLFRDFSFQAPSC